MQTINLKTNPKTDQNSVLQFSGIKKLSSIIKQKLQEQPQKSHELDILQKHLQIK